MALDKRFRKNLAKSGIYDVSLSCDCRLTPALESLFQANEPGWFSINVYSINRVRHMVREMMLVNPDRTEATLSIQYVAGERVPETKPPKNLTKSASLLDILEREEQALFFSIRTEIESYKEETESVVGSDAMVFPLPSDVSVSEDSQSPIDQIRGIRGVKFQKGSRDEVAYSFLLDRPENEEVSLSLMFDLSGAPEAVVDQSLSMTDEIASKFGLVRAYRRL
jgi:hypothetical protein